MADPSEIEDVRQNTNEPDGENGYTNLVIGAYVDAYGVAGASAKIWTHKAAEAAELVNTNEAGSSLALSDLSKNAREMAKYWDAQVAAEDKAAEGPKVKVIERST